MSKANGHDGPPDVPSADELERAAEQHAHDYGPPDANYLDWLAEQQLSKQSPDELAARQDLRAALDTITLDFRHVTPRDAKDGEAGAKANGKAKVIKPRKRVDISRGIRAVDLLRLDLPPLRWVVPDLVPEGTTMLVAPPKIGKSSLVYQMCVEIACGGNLLGRPVTEGSVLYLALEDGPRRGQTKIRTALAGRQMPDKMDVWWNAPTIGNGLEEALAEWVAAQDNPVLVAIDTLERIRPDADARVSAYRVDVRHLSQLQSAFRDSDVALVVVHHSRKEKGDDFVQAVSGTYGLTGSADTIVSIERRRNDQYAVIRATGREVGEIELPARMDANGIWNWAPEALAAASDERLEVYQIIAKHGPIWPQQVARRMGRAGESGRISVQQMITRLAADGVVGRGRKGYTTLIDETAMADYAKLQH